MTQEKPGGSPIRLGPFLIAFLMPTLVGKTLVIYFGLQYSSYPDEGYGWGLVLSICFTVAMIFRFLWKYRHYSD